MKLKPEQVKKFIEINKDCEGFQNLSSKQKEEIANGVANYFLTLFRIHRRIKREGGK